mmetsp:Transcript_19390/g.25610  ORF Transcript_19390/g.25610 Transcript_19390/m.25610 type:complete len:295 (+) Transcript_19390:1737-2621(+)
MVFLNIFPQNATVLVIEIWLAISSWAPVQKRPCDTDVVKFASLSLPQVWSGLREPKSHSTAGSVISPSAWSTVTFLSDNVCSALVPGHRVKIATGSPSESSYADSSKRSTIAVRALAASFMDMIIGCTIMLPSSSPILQATFAGILIIPQNISSVLATMSTLTLSTISLVLVLMDSSKEASSAFFRFMPDRPGPWWQTMYGKCSPFVSYEPMPRSHSKSFAPFHTGPASSMSSSRVLPVCASNSRNSFSSSEKTIDTYSSMVAVRDLHCIAEVEQIRLNNKVIASLTLLIFFFP